MARVGKSPGFSREGVINNSVEAMRSDGTVEVMVAVQGPYISTEVADDGDGMPADLVATAGYAVRSFGKIGGCGLGLFHARKVIGASGGQLNLASTLGQGTQVTLTLPRYVA